jgi:hypothetical protein
LPARSSNIECDTITEPIDGVSHGGSAGAAGDWLRDPVHSILNTLGVDLDQRGNVRAIDQYLIGATTLPR